MSAHAINLPWGWPQMEELLLCPVCYDIPVGPIQLCIQGHHVCAFCREKLRQCPLCKSSFNVTRNYVMEEIVAHLKDIKRLMTDSINRSSSDPDVADNSESSVSNSSSNSSSKRSRPLPIPPPQSRGLFPCRVTGCLDKLPVSRMLNHIRYHHPKAFHEGRLGIDSDTYSQVWEITFTPNDNINAVKVEKMGVFFLVIRISESCDTQVLVQMVASHTAAQQFMYTVRLSGGGENIYYIGKVMSCREPFDQIVYRKNCLVVEANTMRKICQSKTFFRCNVSFRCTGPVNPPERTVRSQSYTT